MDFDEKQLNLGVLNGDIRLKNLRIKSNALSFLQYADHIVSLKDNKIDEQGSFESLLKSKGDFASLMEIHSSTNADDDNTQEKVDNADKKTVQTAATKVDGSATSEKAPSTPKKDGKLIKDMLCTGLAEEPSKFT